MTHKRLLVDVSTGEQYEEDLKPEEVAELEAGFAKAELQKQAEATKATAKAQAEAKLAALGLDADDLKALGLA